MNVQLPDNSVVQFPDGMPEDQVNAAINAHLNSPSSLNPAPSNVQPAGIWEGIKQGAMDPINGLGQLMLHNGPDTSGLGDLDPSKTFDQQLQNQESEYQAGKQAAGRDGIDWSRIAGNTAATIPEFAAIPEVKAAQLAAALGKYGSKAASFVANTISNVGGGGLVGATAPVTDGSDYNETKKDQLLTSAGFIAATSPISKMISKVISPQVSKYVKSLMDENITPTIGQILGGPVKWLEDKATSLPGVGYLIKSAQTQSMDEARQAALARALAPIGKTGPIPEGRAGIQYVKDSLSDAYNNLLPHLQFAPDGQYVNNLINLKNLASNLPDQQANQFNNIIKTQIVDKLGPQGIMDGQTFKGAESELSRAAKGYRGDPSFDNRQLGDVLSQALSETRSALVRSNPQSAQQLNNINQGYANYTILRKAASSLGAEDGRFTPSQLQSAVKAADQSAGKGNFATGNARMQDLSDAAANVLPNKYPDSGTAGREMLGVLMGSALEGGSALGGHALLPLAIGGAASVPYLPGIRQLTAHILAGNRPIGAEQLANALRKSTPALANAYGVTSAQGTNQ